MAVRTHAAPSMSRLQDIAEPTIDPSATIHAFSNLIGDVRIGANVTIAPGTSIRADDGAPFHVGTGTKVQNGVVIHGLPQGRVLGDDEHPYSVWIGDHAAITHLAMIHGPAYVGDRSFIGLRSTVFNARIGADCIVMMHTLIQDVEILPGKYVPSGSVITTQAQADRLPNVRESDRQFVTQMVGINQALRSGYHHPEEIAAIAPQRDESIDPTTQTHSQPTHGGSVNTDVINQVRQLLAQGYRIGTEHADARHFQISSWKSCAPVQATQESSVVRELEACLVEHSGEYVRLIGIDPKAKRRVLETIIQRPTDQPGQTTQNSMPPRPASYSAPRSPSSSNGQVGNGQVGGLGADVVQQVRQLLAQGARIGMEHADVRRFRTSSWTSCSPLEATREADVLAGLQACIAEHAGEYVRLIGIDPQAKRRLAEMIIQRPGQQPQQSSPGASTYTAPDRSSNSQPSSHSASSGMGQDVGQQISQLLAQGYQVGIEHADERRFKTSSWTSETPLQARHGAEAIATLESFIANHSQHYIRVVGIDRQAKRRVAEIIVHRPGQDRSSQSQPNQAQSGNPTPSSSYTPSHSSTNGGSSSMQADPGLREQVRQLIAQNYRIGVEYADERRYRTSSWQTAAPITATREAEIVSTLQAVLNQHQQDYVRLIGIEPKAKRRAVETLIHKPTKK